ncbi:E3 SUMO-protein ligase ZBED1-like isoform X1 [Lates japonicus]|uniref:E3 SUMO-protein ligase ZBED1-like isoform X1 n=1 Tax=Lates japonicus TaxID=270547 RepID=A0AAD3MVH7_LATJO|nr:E3 SUMO-protein ligase ZBED1-like isoform X1 [Lates japonicus]
MLFTQNQNIRQMMTERAEKDKRVERAVGVCRKVVAAFTYFWKKKRDMVTAQEEHHLPQHKLVTESPTSWVHVKE